MLNEPIHVLGAGSIGLLWTASIRSKFPTYPITLLLRDHDRNRKRVASACESSNGTSTHHSRDHDHRIDISWNNRHLTPVTYSNEQAASSPTQQYMSLPVQFINDSKHEQGRIKTLIVATKAHQAKQAVESVLGRLLLSPVKKNNENEICDGDDSNYDTPFSSSPTRIIVLCNGALSVREELSKILPKTPSIGNTILLTLATTTHGAYLSEPHRLVHAGVGTTFLEQQSMDGMIGLWNQAGLNCTPLPSQQMNSMLWNKLAANCVINPLTSIFRCTNGELLMEPSFPELREDILKEIASVAVGVTEMAVGEEEHGTEENAMNGVPTMDEMRNFVTQTIRDTHNNKSSMYQDIITGHQQQTEIEHLNGYVVRKGKEMGKYSPANEDLCSRIAELSAQNSSRNR